MILSTECVVNDKPKDKEASHGHQHGGGGMDGMM